MHKNINLFNEHILFTWNGNKNRFFLVAPRLVSLIQCLVSFFRFDLFALRSMIVFLFILIFCFFVCYRFSPLASYAKSKSFIDTHAHRGSGTYRNAKQSNGSLGIKWNMISNKPTIYINETESYCHWRKSRCSIICRRQVKKSEALQRRANEKRRNTQKPISLMFLYHYNVCHSHQSYVYSNSLSSPDAISVSLSRSLAHFRRFILTFSAGKLNRMGFVQFATRRQIRRENRNSASEAEKKSTCEQTQRYSK